MAIELTFDTTALRRAAQRSPAAVDRALQNGLRDIKNDWQAEAIDISPIKDGTLREQISAEVIMLNGNPSVEIMANAVRDGFNYAYYIHEGEGKAVTGEKKFLDVSAEQNEEKWARWLEDEIEQELRRAGWR